MGKDGDRMKIDPLSLGKKVERCYNPRGQAEDWSFNKENEVPLDGPSQLKMDNTHKIKMKGFVNHMDASRRSF